MSNCVSPGAIEKGATDGQTQYVKDLVAALKAAVTTKPPVKGMARVKGGKGRRRKETFDTTGTEAERAAADTAKAEKDASWGLLEPLHGLLGPVVDIVKPMVSTQLIITVLLVLLLQAWFFGPSRRSTGAAFPLSGPERLAAYETMWQREDAELWDWLEERVGLDMDTKLGQFQQDEAREARQRVAKGKAMGRRLVAERMSERQVDDAIRAVSYTHLTLPTIYSV